MRRRRRHPSEAFAVKHSAYGTVPGTQAGNMGFTYDAMNKLCMIEDYEAWTGQMYNNGPDRQRWKSSASACSGCRANDKRASNNTIIVAVGLSRVGKQAGHVL